MNIPEVVQRIGYFFLNDKRYQYYDDLYKNLKFSRTEMIEHQNNLIKKIVKHAYYNTEYYKNIFNKLNLKPSDIMCKEDLKKLPELTKSNIRNNISQIKSNDFHGKKLIVDYSGGSTGNTAILYKSPFFIQMSRASTLRNNRLIGWKPSDKTVWLWGAPYEHQKIKHSFISKLGILINRRQLFNAYNYSKNDFPMWVEKINQFKPKIIYGYASIILEFSKFLLLNDIRFPFIRFIVSTTETLKGRETIEKAFHCRVYNQYGCREILSISIETSKGVMSLSDDVVAVNHNDQNEFLITALYSYGFPLINYKLGDCGTTPLEIDCENRLPFSTLKLEIGRITDNFIRSTGNKVSSSALGVYIASFQLPLIEYQAIQLDYKKFHINYKPETNHEPEKIKKVFIEIFMEYFGNDIEILIKKVENIPVEKSGKKLMFKCLIRDD
ncbi:MAG: hypothetical protein HQK65_07985 [Desulfamplus sp.]|nr:hypothetical protein [Desulfamplus sp.]